MPLTEEQKDAVAKLPGGQAILDEIETDLTAAVTPLKDSVTKLTDLNTKLTRENVERKRWEQEYRLQMKSLGLDANKPIADLIEEMQEKVKATATKDMKPNAEVDAVNKKLADLTRKFELSEQARVDAEKATKLERVKAAIAPKLPEHFGNAADLILESGILKGHLTTDDSGNPGVKMGEDFIPLSEEEGAKAMNALKQLYPKLAVVKQKGGAGDTPANGGKKTDKTKTMTTAEYNEKVSKGEDVQKFFSEGGQIVD